MRQLIFGTMQVCLGPSFHESGAGLQLAGSGDVEWQAPSRNTYSIIQRVGIKTEYVGILEIWIGQEDNRFGEDGLLWVGKDMGLLYWDILIKDDL